MHDDGFVAFFLTKYEKMAIFGFPFVTKLDKNVSDINLFWEENKPKNGLGRDPQDLEQVWWNYYGNILFQLNLSI